MALTASLVAATPLQLRYLIQGDGEEGGTVTITAAQLLADSVAGALHEMPGIGQSLAQDTMPADQANARMRMLGTGDGVTAPIDLKDHAHATCKITPRTGSFPNAPTVDADLDAVTVTRAELNITMPEDLVNDAILDIAFQHTLVR